MGEQCYVREETHNSESTAGGLEAGPNVATIFVLTMSVQTGKGWPSFGLVGTYHSPPEDPAATLLGVVEKARLAFSIFFFVFLEC